MKKEDIISIIYITIVILSGIIFTISAIISGASSNKDYTFNILNYVDIAVIISGCIFTLSMSLPIILSFIWNCTRFRPFVFLCHDVFGWHEPDDNSINVDEYGFQYSATCKYCGKHIIQDSQGNWF